MNEEIKEIINELKNIRDNFADGVLIDFLNKIEDCITNLQEENQRLKEEKEDYKSRNEKAIDKISKLKPFIPNKIPSWLDELENILNGGDE